MTIKKTIVFPILLLGLCLYGTNVSANVATFHLVSMSGFVESLIAKDIISSDMSARARALVRMVEAGTVQIHKVIHTRNADSVEVHVSRLIQYAGGDTTEGNDIEGLLLITKNTTSKPVELEAKRGCQVVYRIYSTENDTLLYDSASEDRCVTKEKVTYYIEAGKVRMFEINHRNKDFPLTAGAYRFVLEYPGYGKGERIVNVAHK
jgi:hypothetical protein